MQAQALSSNGGATMVTCRALGQGSRALLAVPAVHPALQRAVHPQKQRRARLALRPAAVAELERVVAPTPSLQPPGQGQKQVRGLNDAPGILAASVWVGAAAADADARQRRPTLTPIVPVFSLLCRSPLCIRWAPLQGSVCLGGAGTLAAQSVPPLGAAAAAPGLID